MYDIPRLCALTVSITIIIHVNPTDCILHIQTGDQTPIDFGLFRRKREKKRFFTGRRAQSQMNFFMNKGWKMKVYWCSDEQPKFKILGLSPKIWFEKSVNVIFRNEISWDRALSTFSVKTLFLRRFHRSEHLRERVANVRHVTFPFLISVQ